MKKSLLSVALLAASLICFSQNRDGFKKFDVGPFEVIDEDNNYRLRDGVNIPEYFEFKTPMDQNSFQIDVFFNLPGVCKDVNTYGFDFVWKRKISENWFVNGGIAAAFPTAKSALLFYQKIDGKRTITETDGLSSLKSFYVGIPVSLEYIWGKNRLVSGYFGFGLTPGYYGNGAFDAELYGVAEKLYVKYGYFLAPRVDLGFYAPVGRTYIRAGLLIEYKIDLTDRNVENRFKYGIGKFMPGINVGLVF